MSLAAGTTGAAEGGNAGPSLIIIGWDGAAPELLERFLVDGALPHVARALASGCRRRLRSTIPPVTACAWSSFLSGKNPGKHGLFDFVTPHPGSYRFDYTHGGYRRDRDNDLLRQLNRIGLRVGCVNVPMTFPPYAIDGFMISGLDAPDEGSGIGHPAELFAQAQREVGAYRIDNRHLGSMRTDADREAVLAEFRRIETRRTDVTLAMMRHCPVDVLIIVYNATDQAQHHFWHLMDESHPAHRAGSAEVARFRHAIRDIYRHCDAEVGRLMDAFRGADFMLISDHGAGPTCGPRVRVNHVLAEAGLLTWTGERPGLVSEAVRRVDRFLRRRLSSRQKAWLARMIPGGRTRIEAMSLPPIDWSRTVAFAYEGFTLSPCVWINRADRFPAGTVRTPAEYDDACRRVTEVLTALRDPATGQAVIPQVYRADEVYSGPFVEHCADLILDWWNGATFVMAKSSPGDDSEPSVIGPAREVVSGYDISGIHRRDGILAAWGPHTQRIDGWMASPADLIDIAPTALRLMGGEVDPHMDGRVLEDTIAGTIRAQVSPRSGASGGAVDGSPSEYSEADRAIIEQRLANLGYLE